MKLKEAIKSSRNKLAIGVCQRTGEVFVASGVNGSVRVKGFYGVHIWEQTFSPVETNWRPALRGKS